MPSLPESAKAALPYWGVIEHAATQGYTTQQLWAAIRETAESFGLERPGVGVVGVSQLRAVAGQIQARSAQIAELADGRRLYSTLWSDAPWQRSQGERSANPMYAVRFQHQFTRDGEPVSEWRTVMQYGRPPATVGELRATTEAEAVNMARDYGYGHAGISDLQLLVV